MGKTFMWEFFSRPMLTLEQQIMMEGLVSHMRGAVEQWSDHHNSVYINLMIDSFFSLRLVQNLPLQDVVSLLLAAGCPESAPGGTLPRRRGSGARCLRPHCPCVSAPWRAFARCLTKTRRRAPSMRRRRLRCCRRCRESQRRHHRSRRG